VRFICLFALATACSDNDSFLSPDFSGSDDLTSSGGDLLDSSVGDLPAIPDLIGVDGAPPPSITPGATDHFLIQGTLMLPGGPTNGELLVEGNTITCIGSCANMPGAAGATILRSYGLVIPGLLDPHNHAVFNIFDESDWTPTKLYMNHNQWTAETRYGQMVDAKQYLNGENASPVDVGCEMDKYAEVKALAAATTSIVVAPGATARACYGSLARTIDTSANDLPGDTVQTSISVPSTTTAQGVCNNFASGTTDAYVVHVGEGIDSTAKTEFSTLAGRAGGCLLSPKTTIVHGTAFDATEFGQMATAGMKLVWSPKSNVFLYGATAKIDVAIASGVQIIALGPDWALGGSVNLLDELAFAAAWDDAHLGNVLTNERLFRMVTIDAAKVLGWDSLLGSLEVGKRADLAIVAGDPSDPYASIVRLRPAGVFLVMVDGKALYGDASLVAAGPAVPGCETINVCNASKFICAAETSTTNLLNQTFAQITQSLTQALTNYDNMVAPSGVAPFSPLAPLAKCP
jgi:5-methylthioadenosine/S-adenosylhomocysteine deaminase